MNNLRIQEPEIPTTPKDIPVNTQFKDILEEMANKKQEQHDYDGMMARMLEKRPTRGGVGTNLPKINVMSPRNESSN